MHRSPIKLNSFSLLTSKYDENSVSVSNLLTVFWGIDCLAAEFLVRLDKECFNEESF